MPEIAHLDHEYTPLEQRFQLFREYRGDNGSWDQAIRRTLETEIAPELTPRREGQDYQESIAQKVLQDLKSVLVMNRNGIGATVYGEGQKYRDMERKILFNAGRTWDILDFNSIYSKAVAEGQSKYGVEYQWLRFHKRTGEPEQKMPFYLQHCLIDSVAHPMPEMNNEPDVFYYRFSTPVYGCSVRKDDGRKPTLDNMGTFGWLGKDENWDFATVKDKKFDVIVRDSRKLTGDTKCPVPGCDHDAREITIYICQSGKAFKDAEEVETYPSPFPRNSFFIIPGNEQISELDPHYRFSPLMGPLYPLIAHLNLEYSTLMTLARNEGADDWYHSMQGNTPEQIAAWGALREGGNIETIDRITPGPNQIANYPGTLIAYPRVTSPMLMALIEKFEKKVQDVLPNRLYIGEDHSATANGTGTAVLAALQQAALPFDAPLGNSDAASYAILMSIFHAYRFWALTEPDGAETRWTCGPMTGNENIKRYKATVKPDENIYITASDLECPFDLQLKTENLTEAQKGSLWLRHKDIYSMGFEDQDDVWRDGLGVTDVQGKAEQMFYADVINGLKPLAQSAARARAIQKWNIKLGYSIVDVIGQNEQRLQAALAGAQPPSNGQQAPMGTNPGSTNPQDLLEANQYSNQQGRATLDLNTVVGNAAPGATGVSGGTSPSGY